MFFFLFFLIIDLYFLIPTVFTQIFNPTVELVICTGIPMADVKARNETEAKISKFSI